MTDKKVFISADDELREAISQLAQPSWTIRYDEEGGHWTEGPRGLLLHSGHMSRLHREGWLESFNGGYRLSDAGRAAFIRSTDELGSGELIPPNAT